VLAPPAGRPLGERLHAIHAGVVALIARLRPAALAVEDVFHAQNTRSALVLGQVHGVVLLAGAQAGLAVHALPPATVKVQVTGYGRADKKQVAFMVTRLLGLPGAGEAGDAADALAVALCLANRHAQAPAEPPALRTPRRRSAG
jgi:crossover junction endodeoxyribonuclease RuvC